MLISGSFLLMRKPVSLSDEESLSESEFSLSFGSFFFFCSLFLLKLGSWAIIAVISLLLYFLYPFLNFFFFFNLLSEFSGFHQHSSLVCPFFLHTEQVFSFLLFFFFS